MDEGNRDWHLMFVTSWEDFLTGQPVEVESEVDLSLKQQWLDVVFIHKGDQPLTVTMPDGFKNLARYYLLSFKSFREPLDGWALTELLGHYVNYRKQISPNMNDLLPEADFRLFAVTVRFPQNLRTARRPALRRVRDGVYAVDHYTGELYVVVVHELPREQNNAMLHLFSAEKEAFEYARQHHRLRSQDTTTFLKRLFDRYLEEGDNVPFDFREYLRQVREDFYRDMTPEDRRALVSGLTQEDLIKAVKTLSPEAKEALRRELEAEKPSPDSK